MVSRESRIHMMRNFPKMIREMKDEAYNNGQKDLIKRLLSKKYIKLYNPNTILLLEKIKESTRW